MARLVSPPEIDIEVRITKLGRGPSGSFEVFEFELVVPEELDAGRPWTVIDAQGNSSPIIIRSMAVGTFDGVMCFRGLASVVPMNHEGDA